MKASILKFFRIAPLWACGMALAAPFGSVPSVAPVGAAVAVSGGGMVPGAAISARVTAPDRTVSMAAAIADAKGAVVINITTSQPGNHAIDLIDPSGAVVVTGLKLIASR